MRKKNFVKISTIIVMVFLSICVFSTLISAQTIRIWSFNPSAGSAALKVIRNEIIPEFEEKHPGVEVKWQGVPYDGYREKLLTAAAGKDMPDIFLDGSTMSGLFISKGLAVPITKYIKGWDIWEDFMETARDHATYEGEIYGVPTRMKINPPLYNIEALKSAGLDIDNLPTTWDGLLDWGKKLLKIEDNRVVFQGISSLETPSTRVRVFDLLLQQNGGSLLTEDLSAPAFNSEKGLETLNFFIDLYKITNPIGVAPLTEQITTNYAVGLQGISSFDSYNTINKCLLTGQTDIFEKTKVGDPFKGPASDGKALLIMDGDMTFLSSSSQNPELAIEFIKFFFEPENHLKYVKANKILPLEMSLMNSDYVLNTPLYKEMMEYSDCGWDLMKTPEYREMRYKLLDEIDKAIFGKQTPEKALAKGEKIWIQGIKDYR